MSRYSFGMEDEVNGNEYWFNFTAPDNSVYAKVAEVIADVFATGEPHTYDSWWARLAPVVDNLSVHQNHVGESDHTLHLFNPDANTVALFDNDTQRFLVEFDAYRWTNKYGVTF